MQNSKYLLDYYSVEFDLPKFDGIPRLKYMIATVPRSGSTMLALTLMECHMFGAPLEYLNSVHMDAIRYRSQSHDALGYWQTLIENRTSLNGLFGFKAFVTDLKRIAMEEPLLLPCLAVDKVVYLTRADITAQAVSYAKASQSGKWFSTTAESREPVYDFRKIRAAEVELERQYDAWERLFTLTKPEILRISYEDLVENSSQTLDQIAVFLEVSGAKIAHLSRGLSKQRDNISDSWRERYLSEKVMEK